MKGYLLAKTKEGLLISEEYSGELAPKEISKLESRLTGPSAEWYPKIEKGYGRIRLLKNTTSARYNILKYIYFFIITWVHSKNIQIYKIYYKKRMLLDFHGLFFNNKDNPFSKILLSFLIKGIYYRCLFVLECIVIPPLSIIFMPIYQLYYNFIVFRNSKSNLLDAEFFDHFSKLGKTAGKPNLTKIARLELLANRHREDYKKYKNAWHEMTNKLLTISLAIIAILASYFVGTLQIKEDEILKNDLKKMKDEVKFFREYLTP